MNSHLSNETFSVEQGPTTISKVLAIITAISNQRDATKTYNRRHVTRP